MQKLPIVATLITFICIVILLKLGFWQLQRAEQKKHIGTEQQKHEDRVYPDIFAALESPGSDRFRRVNVSGKMDTLRYFFWDNRVLDGIVGYEVIVPVITGAGTLMVNLGWLKDPHFRQQLPEFEIQTADFNAVVVLYQPQQNQLSQNLVSTGDWPRLIQEPDTEKMAMALGVAVLPSIGFLEATEQYQLKNNFKPVTMSPEKHLGYAVQWFMLALGCFIVYLFALRKKYNHERNNSE